MLTARPDWRLEDSAMKRLAVLLVLLLPGCAVYPVPPAYHASYYRPPPPPVVVYPGYGYRPWHGGGWGRRW
jgi:hypothetical protein